MPWRNGWISHSRYQRTRVRSLSHFSSRALCGRHWMELEAKGLSRFPIRITTQFQVIGKRRIILWYRTLKNLKLHSKYSFTITVENGRFIGERKGLWHRGSIFSLHLAGSSSFLAFKVFLFQMECKDQFYLIDIIWATEVHSTDFFIYLISVKDCTPSAFYEPKDVQWNS